MSKTLKKMILIIEDDTAIRDSIKELLEDEGYRVSAASNGQEALEMLRASLYKPNLILLDLMMPIKDGFQFREEQLHEEALSKIPVIIMSANGNIGYNQLKQAGVEGYLKKPLDLDTLLDEIKKLA